MDKYNRSMYPYGTDDDITLDATTASENRQEMQLFERDDLYRRSDQKNLIANNHLDLPQVYGDGVTPSTPGVDENKLLIKRTQLQMENDGPPDRMNLVYWIMLINGVGVLMPWNMFINADAYFREFKLGNTVYAKDFQSYVGMSAQIPNALFNLLNLFVQIKGSLTARILTSLVVVIAIFVLTAILAMIDSSSWPGAFFGITMVTVVILNCAVGIYQNCVYGLAADLPMSYTNSVIIGMNVSGTFVSILNIATMSLSPDKRIAAIYYFIATLFVLLVCFDSYFVLPLCKFFRYYHDRGMEHRMAEELQRNKKTNTSCVTYLQLYKETFRESWIYMFSIFFTFFVTLTIFPAIQADIRPYDNDFWIEADDSRNRNYFRAITCFLFFNVFATLGSTITNWFHFPGPRFVWIPVLLRGFMIPFFMFCNYRPTTRLLPVYITNEYAYIFMGILMAFSSGYLSSLIMMYAPRVVSPDKSRVTAMMAAFFLVLGLCGGVNFALVVSKIVGDSSAVGGLNGTVTMATTTFISV